MEALSDAQRMLIAQIISNPSQFATYSHELNSPWSVRASDASQPIFPVPQSLAAPASQISPARQASTMPQPVNGTTQQVIGTHEVEEQRHGTITPTSSELVDSPTNRQMLRNGSQSPDFGGFKPHCISALVASFTPLFETDYLKI